VDIGGAEAVRLSWTGPGPPGPARTVDEHNAAQSRRSCQRLDGLPLALSCRGPGALDDRHQIAERLDDRFRLLTAGSRTSMPRHRTLRAW